MRTMIRLAGERETLRVVADQWGTPTSARTIAETLVDIIERNEADVAAAFEQARGLVHVTNSGATTWHGFASAIVQGLRSRGVALKATEIVAIASKEYPTKASRPANSRLDLARLDSVYGIQPPAWASALADELDRFVNET